MISEGSRYDTKTLSQIPAANEIVKSKVFSLTVPVFMLQAYRPSTWKDKAAGAFVFTDFTEVKDSILHHSSLRAPGLKPHFISKRINMIHTSFTTSCTAKQFFDFTTQLEAIIGPKESRYDNSISCSIEVDGVFAILQLDACERTKDGYQGVTAYLRDFELIKTKEQVREWAHQNKHFRDLLVRFSQYADPISISRADARLEILDILEPITNDTRTSNKTNNTQESQGLQSQYPQGPPQKKARLTGAALLRAPQDDDSQSDSQMDSDEDFQDATDEAIDEVAATIPNQSASESSFSSASIRLNEPSEINSLLQTQRASSSVELPEIDTILINKTNIRNLNAIADDANVVGGEKVFEIDAYIKGMLPLSPIIIKPVGRTLKVTSFKLQLYDKPGRHLNLEFRTEKEICDFLGVSEVEELIDKIDEIAEAMNSISSKTSHLHKLIKVKRVYTELPGKFKVLYSHWTCLNTLEDFLKGIY